MNKKNKKEIVKEIANEVYNDAIKPTTKNVGQFFGIVSEFFTTVVVYPLKKLSIEFKEKTIAFERGMKEKYNNIPEEKRVEPNLSIVGPTMEALKYRILEDELAEMFSNLLISNLDMDKHVKCSPSYIKIIEQMSSVDAIVYKKIVEKYENRSMPICSCIFELAGFSEKKLANDRLPKNIIDKDDFNMDEYVLSKSIDSLSRLGLITISNTRSIPDNNVYEKLIKQDYIIKLLNEYNSEKTYFVPKIHEKGVIYISEFSKDFAKVCITDKKNK